MNQQRIFSSLRGRALLVLALAPWAAACQPPGPESAASPVPGAIASGGGCAATDGVLKSLASVDDVRAALANKWEYCSGEPANFKEPTEFTADGRWHTLTRDGSGQLVQKGGFAASGTYEIMTQGPAPWGYVTIVLHYDSFGSSLSTNLAFLGMPLVMQNGPGIYVPTR